MNRLNSIEAFAASYAQTMNAIDKMRMLGVQSCSVQIEVGQRWMARLFIENEIGNLGSIVYERDPLLDGDRVGELVGFFADIPVVEVEDMERERGKLCVRWKCLVGVTENEYRRRVSRLQKAASGG